MATDQAAEIPEKTLEYWLTRCTDPYVSEANRQELIKSFCEQVNNDLEGHTVACRLLAHKIQSPYEKEALNAFAALEACVRNCGQRFHNEIAKFRFLNEMIKILSPKYLGNQTTEKVKQRAIELLYAWKQSLRHLPKIKQAYDMLREQGIINQDPTYMDEIYEAPMICIKPRLASFEDEEKAKLLAQLLKSRNPDDLVAANRLIKSMVRAEDQRMEKMSKRQTDLQTASNNARLLMEMVSQYNSKTSSEQDRELIKELVDSLQKLRPSLYRYAGEAAEGDETVLAEVLACNDDVSKAVDEYRLRVEPHVSISTPPSNPVGSSNAASSLLNFDIPVQSSSAFSFVSDLSSATSDVSISSDDVLMLGGGGTPLISRKNTSSNVSAASELHDIFGGLTPGARSSLGPTASKFPAVQNIKTITSPTAANSNANKQKGLLDLDELSESLIQQHLPTGATSTTQIQHSKKTPLRDLSRPPGAGNSQQINGAGLLDSNVPVTLPTIDAQSPSTDAVRVMASYERESSSTITPTLKPCPMTPHSTPTMSGQVSPTASTVDLQKVSASISNEARSGKLIVTEMSHSQISLDNIHVPLESIQPSTKESVCLLDRDQLKILLHYTANRPRPEVLTTVISITSTRSQPLSNVRFEAKICDKNNVVLRLLEPTSTGLPAYNPIFPQMAITQITLFASDDVSTGAIRIPVEFSLTYDLGEQHYSITGCTEVEYWRSGGEWRSI